MTPNAEQRRRQAIERYLAGDKIDAICREMHCSKSWLYKWKDRYRQDDPTWAQTRSRRPRTQVRRTPPEIEQAVAQLRQALTQTGSPAGAAAIEQALRQQGLQPVPSCRTIDRILQRQGKKENATA